MEPRTDKPGSPPPQRQARQPGRESKMHPTPQSAVREYRASNKLEGKVAIVTGGDSGIGRAVAIAFAKEGADVVISYLEEHDDAKDTQAEIEAAGRRCVRLAGDIADEAFCRRIVDKAIAEFGHIDVLVNNAAEQHPQERIEDISREQLVRTFETNLFSMFYLTKAVMPHLKSGARIVNSTSVTAYRGSPHLVDYASTKGAIVAFTRSLSKQLASREIYVNAVAPGPIWTPLIPASFDEEKVGSFGSDVPLGRPGQPDEVAPCYVFLACEDSSYMTGQVLHPNGGEVVNG
jgi:NAD(P)-dependent dehydrogenase (short-subunit alcohol dehydrogenase family)